MVPYVEECKSRWFVHRVISFIIFTTILDDNDMSTTRITSLFTVYVFSSVTSAGTNWNHITCEPAL